MNKITITGNIGKDLELRYSTKGTAVLEMSIAVKRPFEKDKTDWFNVVCLGKTAENCANYLAKGSKVLVVGSMQFETYDKKDGSGKGYSNKLVAQEVEFLDSKASGNTGSATDISGEAEAFSPKSLDEGYRALEDDDVPF